MSSGWEQPPSHPPSSLSFSLPHGSEIIHPPTDRCCVGGRCQSARSMWCKGYACLRLVCMCIFVHMNARVYICEHVRVGVLRFMPHLYDWMRTRARVCAFEGERSLRVPCFLFSHFFFFHLLSSFQLRPFRKQYL